MAIRDCTLIAVEGTHASGKTTLAHALVAQYRERGFHAGTTGEAARTNPFIEDVVLRGHGAFDLAAEVDLFASQLSAELRSARSRAMLIADGTLANVLAYAGLLLAPTAGSREAAVLDALAHFCRAWAPTYDAVFLCQDRYAQRDGGDEYRAKVLTLQDDVATAIRETCRRAGLPVIEIPTGLSVAARVAFVGQHLADLELPKPNGGP